MITQYNISDVLQLFKSYDSVLDSETLQYFREIKKINVFNPTKFYNKKISFNNWRKNLDKQNSSEEKNEKDIILEKIKTILNKLTLKSYETLHKKLIDTIDNNKEILKTTIEFLFNRSLIQKIYCGLYAKLCNDLYNHYGDSVKSLILQKCKENFYSQKSIITTNVDTDYDILCKILKQKMKFIGIFHLVGNLYKANMVNEMVIEKYLNLLLDSFDTHLDDDVREKYVECFKELFALVVQKLKKNISEDSYKEYIQKIHMLSNKKEFKPREKFMLMDIIDLIET